MEEKELIWQFGVEEIIHGYRSEQEEYHCVFCGKTFTKGRIYTYEEEMYDAYGAVKEHVLREHGSCVDYLLKREPAMLGISSVQQRILTLMAEGKEDRVIAKEVGIATSTVRNHRFKLREKEKQAKLFLALMQSLQEKTNRSISQSDAGEIEEVHDTAKMVDDRYSITAEDCKKTVKTYMTKEGAIKQFPSKEKKKIILLREVMKNFVRDREYSEWEINTILKRIYEDYPTIRRALVEYGFMDRSDDCTVYRVKE